MGKSYKSYDLDQAFLLPPSLREWLPGNHLAYFISDVVHTLDLAKIEDSYGTDERGQPPYHPAMMVALLFYGYATGIPSSRKIERKTYEDIAFRVLAAGHYPDHDTISSFRKAHLHTLKDLFLQILLLCQEAHLVKVGHISLDGTKMKASASKHKAMSYERMGKKERELEQEIEALLAKADEADAEEDRRYGKGKRGDELPKELAFRETRLKKIKEAKAALEKRMKEKGKDTPSPKDQINFTDPESRIMKDSASKEFIQGYNAQCAVDTKSQIIVAADVTIETNDKKQIEPMTAEIRKNLRIPPRELSADAGYFSEDNITFLKKTGIEAFIPPDRLRHTTPSSSPVGRIPKHISVADRMRRLLRTVRGKTIYGKRKETVEPVFGQIKEERGFRRFLLRGHEKVKAEWQLICLTHNLLKLYRWKMAQETI
jgi:transposase